MKKIYAIENGESFQHPCPLREQREGARDLQYSLPNKSYENISPQDGALGLHRSMHRKITQATSD